MSVFLTPSLEPVVGGTYFPPEDSMGRPGFKTLLRALADKWEAGEAQKADLVRSGKKILEALKEATKQEAQVGYIASYCRDHVKCFLASMINVGGKIKLTTRP